MKYLVSREELKKVAVDGAMDWIKDNYDLESNLTIGVGSGSTVSYAFSEIANYKNLVAVPTSSDTRKSLEERGMRVRELKEISGELVFDIDGADEVDPALNLIKGGGGCHYREKKVAKRSDKLIIVVDETKLVDYLGQSFPLPVEVQPVKKDEARSHLSQYGEPILRKDGGKPVKTDNSNFIFDLELDLELSLTELAEWEEEINRIAGVVENGFFVKRKADLVFVGMEDGVEVLKSNRKR